MKYNTFIFATLALAYLLATPAAPPRTHERGFEATGGSLADLMRLFCPHGVRLRNAQQRRRPDAGRDDLQPALG